MMRVWIRVYKLYKTYIVAICFLLVAGCVSAPHDFSQDVHLRARSVEVYDVGLDPKRTFTKLEWVKSNSCDSKSVTRYTGSIEEAEWLIRLKAASIYADAVVNFSCRTGVVDLASNCWASKKCSGLAVKYKVSKNKTAQSGRAG